jgi:Ca2+/Na+ antiporter
VTIQQNQKFIAFILMGLALMTLAVLLYVRPIPDSSANSGVLQILNMIIGAFIGAFGSSVNALFRSSTDSVKVTNKPNEPVPTEPGE